MGGVRVTVIYSPSGEFIGNADTERGALRCAARVPLGYPGRERYTANVGAVIDRDDMADFTLVWLVGPVLAQGGRKA
jgi:hypothetical protein